jgi:hypothetical protein
VNQEDKDLLLKHQARIELAAIQNAIPNLLLKLCCFSCGQSDAKNWHYSEPFKDDEDAWNIQFICQCGAPTLAKVGRIQGKVTIHRE